jgi:hypothetical protein
MPRFCLHSPLFAWGRVGQMPRPRGGPTAIERMDARGSAALIRATPPARFQPEGVCPHHAPLPEPAPGGPVPLAMTGNKPPIQRVALTQFRPRPGMPHFLRHGVLHARATFSAALRWVHRCSQISVKRFSRLKTHQLDRFAYRTQQRSDRWAGVTGSEWVSREEREEQSTWRPSRARRQAALTNSDGEPVTCASREPRYV